MAAELTSTAAAIDAILATTRGLIHELIGKRYEDVFKQIAVLARSPRDDMRADAKLFDYDLCVTRHMTARKAGGAAGTAGFITPRKFTNALSVSQRVAHGLLRYVYRELVDLDMYAASRLPSPRLKTLMGRKYIRPALLETLKSEIRDYIGAYVADRTASSIRRATAGGAHGGGGAGSVSEPLDVSVVTIDVATYLRMILNSVGNAAIDMVCKSATDRDSTVAPLLNLAALRSTFLDANTLDAPVRRALVRVTPSEGQVEIYLAAQRDRTAQKMREKHMEQLRLQHEQFVEHTKHTEREFDRPEEVDIDSIAPYDMIGLLDDPEAAAYEQEERDAEYERASRPSRGVTMDGNTGDAIPHISDLPPGTMIRAPFRRRMGSRGRQLY
jgi:hypothetical protein